MAKKKVKVKKSKKSELVENTDTTESKAMPSDASKGPIFNSGRKNQGINTQVEVAKGTMGDSFQTNSLPKDNI